MEVLIYPGGQIPAGLVVGIDGPCDPPVVFPAAPVVFPASLNPAGSSGFHIAKACWLIVTATEVSAAVNSIPEITENIT